MQAWAAPDTRRARGLALHMHPGTHFNVQWAWSPVPCVWCVQAHGCTCGGLARSVMYGRDGLGITRTTSNKRRMSDARKCHQRTMATTHSHAVGSRHASSPTLLMTSSLTKPRPCVAAAAASLPKVSGRPDKRVTLTPSMHVWRCARRTHIQPCMRCTGVPQTLGGG